MVFISLTLCTKSPGRSGVYLLTGFFFLFPFNISTRLYPVISLATELNCLCFTVILCMWDKPSNCRYEQHSSYGYI